MAVTLRPVRARGRVLEGVDRAGGCSRRDRRGTFAEAAASSRSFSLSSRRVGWPASGVADVSLERAGIGEVGRSGVNGAVGFRSFSDVHRGMPLH
ncbi:hypothetical protein ASE16_01745 [Leifsonia sp. Root227]|nr:hypothetical protein ASE16_01745 [Leifsonia sp. Root227]